VSGYFRLDSGINRMPGRENEKVKNIDKKGLEKMKIKFIIKNSTREMIKTINRYPFTTGFLVAAMITNIIMIERGSEILLERLLMTFLVGAMATVVAQLVTEEFLNDRTKGFFATGFAFLLTGIYYLGMRNIEFMNQIILTRTTVITLIFVVSYVLIPSMKREKDINHYLMAAVKSFFTTILFSAVIFAGIAAILGATDQLLFSIYNNLYGHFANIIFILFAPIFFLSMEDRFEAPKFFANLLTYVAIPLLGVFTLILVTYIVTNLRAGFWTDNLLEPMLVSYSIVVLLIIFLVSTLDHKIVERFMTIFPKVILVIFIFQTIASILKIQESGMTHGRYYAILYGVFSVIAAVLLSFSREKKNHWIAIVLIVFSLISLIPPIDAFSYSIRSQETRSEEVLEENNMIVDGEIVQAEDLSREEKDIIIESLQYLDRIGAAGRVEWLPEDFQLYRDFEQVFGFPHYPWGAPEEREFVSFRREHNTTIIIEGYQVLVPISFDSHGRSPGSNDENPYSKKFSLDEEVYIVGWMEESEEFVIYRENEGDQPLIQYSLMEFQQSLEEVDKTFDEPLTVEEASYELRGENIKAKIILNHFERTSRLGDERYYGEVLFLIGSDNE